MIVVSLPSRVRSMTDGYESLIFFNVKLFRSMLNAECRYGAHLNHRLDFGCSGLNVATIFHPSDECFIVRMFIA